MCGITGILSIPTQAAAMHASVTRMADTLAHRGPDDSGVYVEAESGLALGHRRLSILDLSSEGHQPMHSACGRYIIVFNGEIYNYRSLRPTLEAAGQTFHGQSDTEVLLSAIAAWGLEAAVEKCVGMFAFALWDRQKHCLHLVRDRIGIKPLYYGWQGDTLLFASELKAIHAADGFVPRVNRNALALYFRYTYIPAPHSIYEGIYKLPPGCILTLHGARPTDFSPQADAVLDGRSSPRRYWSYKSCVEEGASAPYGGSFAQATDQLEDLLHEAVACRMVSDVPLGAFLSGGIDSSLTVALMQSVAQQPVKTFTIGFEDSTFDEAGQARAIAAHLGTAHTEWRIKPSDAMERIHSLATVWDEPFADSSQVPTLLLSSLTRQHVTVALSGDGGDELFAGYRRYFQGMRYLRWAARVPAPLRQALSIALQTAARCPGLTPLMRCLQPILPRDCATLPPDELLRKIGWIFAARTPQDFYQTLVSHWADPGSLVIGGQEPLTVVNDPVRHAQVDDFTRQMMYFDTVQYHPDDILTKVDRASMAVGLEARVPLMDHRIAEYAARLPLSYLMQHGVGKRILRAVLYRHVPQALVDHPKRGFAIPLADWLRGDCRAWAESLLDEKRLREAGYLHVKAVRTAWQDHCSGRQDRKHALWAVLMFEAWRTASRIG